MPIFCSLLTGNRDFPSCCIFLQDQPTLLGSRERQSVPVNSGNQRWLGYESSPSSTATLPPINTGIQLPYYHSISNPPIITSLPITTLRHYQSDNYHLTTNHPIITSLPITTLRHYQTPNYSFTNNHPIASLALLTPISAQSIWIERVFSNSRH